MEIYETGNEGRDWIGPTEVGGFENCEAISNEQLASYLSEVIPPAHFFDCPSITLDPQNSCFSDEPLCQGFYEVDSHAIHIGDKALNNSVEGVLDTVVHEIGHNAYSWLETCHPSLAAQWQAVHQSSLQQFSADGMGFVTSYARSNSFEDFAESYKAYIRDPELLQVMSPEKYEFMRDFVFAAREYASSAFLHPNDMATLNINVGPAILEAKQQFERLPDIEKEALQGENIISSEDASEPQRTYRCFSILAST